MQAAALERINAWYELLHDRHLRELTFPQVRKGLQALSTVYVQERQRLGGGAALDGAGKRAAFAWYYGVRHFQLVSHIVQARDLASSPLECIVDLGCGTGVGSAAWAMALQPCPSIVGLDLNPWVLDEARFNFNALNLRARLRRTSLSSHGEIGSKQAVLAAFAVNEIHDDAREHLLQHLLRSHQLGAKILIVEPMAKAPNPWWSTWASCFVARGGHEDTWRLNLALPPQLELLGKAAGLRPRDIAARSLILDSISR